MYKIAEDFWRKITPRKEKPDQPQCSLVAQTVKTLLAMWETCVQSLGGEDPLERGTATYSSILAWGFQWTKETCRLQSMGSQRVRHDRATLTHSLTHLGTVQEGEIAYGEVLSWKKHSV